MKPVIVHFGNGRTEVWTENKSTEPIEVHLGNGRTETWTEAEPTPRNVQGTTHPARPHLEVVK